MHETIDCYAFENNKSVKLKIFKIPVSYADKNVIETYIAKIEKSNN